MTQTFFYFRVLRARPRLIDLLCWSRIPSMLTWIFVPGVLAQGYHVASGPSADYPYGALDRQRPIFLSRGLDLRGYFNGTLNIDIRPRRFAMVKPQFTFRSVEWTDLHPPEDFSFSRCRVVFRDLEYDGWVYYPHPQTKLRNFQNPSLLEVIAQTIPGIRYGDALGVWVNEEEIEASLPSTPANDASQASSSAPSASMCG